MRLCYSVGRSCRVSQNSNTARREKRRGDEQIRPVLIELLARFPRDEREALRLLSASARIARLRSIIGVSPRDGSTLRLLLLRWCADLGFGIALAGLEGAVNDTLRTGGAATTDTSGDGATGGGAGRTGTVTSSVVDVDLVMSALAAFLRFLAAPPIALKSIVSTALRFPPVPAPDDGPDILSADELGCMTLTLSIRAPNQQTREHEGDQVQAESAATPGDSLTPNRRRSEPEWTSYPRRTRTKVIPNCHHSNRKYAGNMHGCIFLRKRYAICLRRPSADPAPARCCTTRS